MTTLDVAAQASAQMAAARAVAEARARHRAAYATMTAPGGPHPGAASAERRARLAVADAVKTHQAALDAYHHAVDQALGLIHQTPDVDQPALFGETP